MNRTKNSNEIVTRHASKIANVKANIKSVERLAYDTSFVVEDIAQYLRRDWLEITGVIANQDCPAEAITKLVGNVIGLPLQDNDISIAHPISTYNEDAPP